MGDTKHGSLGKRDGSWAVDDGAVLDVPAKSQAQLDIERPPEQTPQKFMVATLSTGQVFGESCVFKSSAYSNVKIVADSTVELIVVSQSDCRGTLMPSFDANTRQRLKHSYINNDPNDRKLVYTHLEREEWEKEKRRTMKQLMRYK